MNSIGIIYFLDMYGNSTSTYIYGAMSLTALKQYCETLRVYSAAVITKIAWSEGGEMQYDRKKALSERKSYVFDLPVQEMDLMWSGQPGDAYSVLYRGKCVLKYALSNWPRYAFIPAPLATIFEKRDIKQAVGDDIAAAYSHLINTPTTFANGYFITPLI